MILYVSRFMLNRWKLVLNGAVARIRVAAFPYALGAVYEIVNKNKNRASRCPALL